MDYLGLCIIIVIIISNVDNSSVNHVYLHKTIDLRLNQILHLHPEERNTYDDAKHNPTPFANIIK